MRHDSNENGCVVDYVLVMFTVEIRSRLSLIMIEKMLKKTITITIMTIKIKLNLYNGHLGDRRK